MHLKLPACETEYEFKNTKQSMLWFSELLDTIQNNVNVVVSQSIHRTTVLEDAIQPQCCGFSVNIQNNVNVVVSQSIHRTTVLEDAIQPQCCGFSVNIQNNVNVVPLEFTDVSQNVEI
jgi:hypothetical protein